MAFCTDTFDEPNGVATISREFAAYARIKGYPLMLVRPGSRNRVETDGSLTSVEVERSSCCIPLDMGLRFDMRIFRHYPWMHRQLTAFNPDVVHITGPGDIGMLCARLSHILRVPKPPLVAAWHTNLHQYARMRLAPVFDRLPGKSGTKLGDKLERGALFAASRFYQTARLILAPNASILGELTTLTGKAGQLMPHGVDTKVFVPSEAAGRDPITLGYVGRLTPEKNVRFLAEVAAHLPARTRAKVRFLIVGDGSERGWLEQQLPGARFTGVLRGKELAAAYAAMDLFLFPSLSDTFGLVVLEAMSAGVPVISFRQCGPQSAVEHGLTGYTGCTAADFIEGVGGLVNNDVLRGQLRLASRRAAERYHWAYVFESLYSAYASILPARPTSAA